MDTHEQVQFVDTPVATLEDVIVRLPDHVLKWIPIKKKCQLLRVNESFKDEIEGNIKRKGWTLDDKKMRIIWPKHGETVITTLNNNQLLASNLRSIILSPTCSRSREFAYWHQSSSLQLAYQSENLRNWFFQKSNLNTLSSLSHLQLAYSTFNPLGQDTIFNGSLQQHALKKFTCSTGAMISSPVINLIRQNSSIDVFGLELVSYVTSIKDPLKLKLMGVKDKRLLDLAQHFRVPLTLVALRNILQLGLIFEAFGFTLPRELGHSSENLWDMLCQVMRDDRSKFESLEIFSPDPNCNSLIEGTYSGPRFDSHFSFLKPWLLRHSTVR